MTSHMRRLVQFFHLPVLIQWRTLLLRLPWLVPRWPTLHFTSSEGPFPAIIHLPSRGLRKIPIYIFLSPVSANAGLPIHLDFHGGGFVMGSCLEQAPFCALLARETGRLVITVDYRLGPLDQFPAAIEDAEDVLAAVLDSKGESKAGLFLRREIKSLQRRKGYAFAELDSERLSLSGFSSGGNLALNLALSIPAIPEKNISPWSSLLPSTGRPVPILLFYPSFDSRIPAHKRHRPAGLPEPSRMMVALSELAGTYLPDEQRAHPRASPGLADLKSGGLNARGRILLVLPELDNLAGQSEVWLSKAREEGIGGRIQVERVKGVKHGWTQYPEVFLSAYEKSMRREAFEKATKFINAEGLIGNASG